ncbi:MAG: MBOAT family O-acyltransferase [Gemmataceae bacterium]
MLFATEGSAASLPYFAWLGQWLPLPFFHTPAFLAFFAIVASVYWLTPRRCVRLRTWILVIASFHFYAAWSAELAFLVTATATVDYLLARGMSATERPRLRLALMISSIAMNLGILCYFKYANFFLDSLNQALALCGAHSAFSTLTILVPFGISFYTFEAISYAVDVYKKKIPAERSLSAFLLFILFFPHLVSGPIVRAGDFLPQVFRRKHWNWLRVQVGVQFFLMGVFKKLALADRFALFCDPVWSDPAAYNTNATWLAVLAYALRIYFDFSGYSDMAVGTAHLLGFRLTQNFNMPYLAANVSEFWHRWHISLSTWLRDYLFIPLGGSRGGVWATNRNLMITMILGGLWHGATWSFAIWGALHGLFLVVHRAYRHVAEQRPSWQALLTSPYGRVGRTALTILCVGLAWVFFRKDLAGAITIFQHLFTIQPGLGPPLPNRSLWTLVAIVALCHTLAVSGSWRFVWPRLPAEVQGFAYATCLIVAMVLAPDQNQAFIYFDF